MIAAAKKQRKPRRSPVDDVPWEIQAAGGEPAADEFEAFVDAFVRWMLHRVERRRRERGEEGAKSAAR